MESRSWLAIYVLILLLTGCRNYLETFSEPDSDRAKFTEASLALNVRDFDSALVWIGRMTSDYRNTRQVKFLEASAHSGKCGMEAMSFLQTVDAASDGSANFFTVLMAAFPGGTLTQASECLVAENLLRSISTTATLRTANENIFLALVSLAKIGIILNDGADLNDNGLVDDGFSSPDHCNSTTVLEDGAVDELVTGLAIFIESIEASGLTFGADELGSVNDICAALAGSPDPSYNFCGVTDTSDVTANHRKGMRTIFGASQGIGLGICTGDETACLCP